MEKEKRKGRTLLKILITTLYLSTFTFGGGYVIVSLMKKKFVDEKHWIEQDEMLDLVAIAQSSPGPIAGGYSRNDHSAIYYHIHHILLLQRIQEQLGDQ